MKPKFQWEPNTGRFSHGEWLRVGRVIVGSAGYYAYASKGDPVTYVCNILLPGIKAAPDKYATLDEAKARLEKQVRTWLAWLSDGAEE